MRNNFASLSEKIVSQVLATIYENVLRKAQDIRNCVA